jgi:predicted GH43/DUF377 family glycosyl hydrolase
MPMKKESQYELFRRHPGNPIVTANNLPYPVNSVFNAGATKVADETLLLMRVEDRRGHSHLTAARSKDGVSGWRIEKKPTLAPSPEKHPEEIWGIEDPRITRLPQTKTKKRHPNLSSAEAEQFRIEERDVWAVVYTAFSDVGPLVSLATTSDFRKFERAGPIMPPENKDAALFPVKFKGRYAMLHRPVPFNPGAGAHIWISFSPDLGHWGGHRVLLRAREGTWWDANKIGLSTPPMKTDEGWLLLYHGVRETVSGSIYRLGLTLLDLDDPTEVIRRSDEWVFGPSEDYERTGDVGNVAFPCGWVLEGDEVRIYYGAADTSIALATASLAELLAWLKKHGEISC